MQTEEEKYEYRNTNTFVHRRLSSSRSAQIQLPGVTEQAGGGNFGRPAGEAHYKLLAHLNGSAHIIKMKYSTTENMNTEKDNKI